MLVREERGRAARLYLYSSVFWLVTGLAVGVLVTFLFGNPDFYRNAPGGLRQVLHFARLQPVYMNTLIFGWLSMALIGVALTLAPRLTGIALRHESLAQLSAWGFNLVVALGNLGLLAGVTKGRELAEYPLPLNWLWLLSLVAVAVVLLDNYRRRLVQDLYVSLWYFAGSLVWVAILYFLGNVMWKPNGVLWGVADAIVHWFYASNVVHLWLGMMGLGVAYYLVPVLAERPLYSQTLATVGFWGMACFLPATGAYLMWNPMPSWFQSSVTAFAALLTIPMWAVLANLTATIGDRWGTLWRSPAGKFLVAGLAFYLLTWIALVAENLPAVSGTTFFTYWVSHQAHLGLMGAYGFTALAGVYYALPVLLKRQWDVSAARLHFWLTLVGTLVMVLSLAFAGFAQGSVWASGEAFAQSVAAARAYLSLHAFGTLLVLVAQVVFVYQVFKITSASPLGVAMPEYREARHGAS